ncbi:MAG: glycosyl transferase family protein [Solirubrobacterales bacterium]|nr:glycosyl transferase family protein [Solirubrobacterales bacterium]
MRNALELVNVMMLVYLVVLDVAYGTLALLGWQAVESFVRRRPVRDYELVSSSPLSPPVSVIVPAYDEQETIVSSVQAMLALHYPSLEVIVVNDGSSDMTFDRLREAFRLVPAARVPRSAIDTEHVRGTYVSAVDERLVVLDKENGGKADALNAGLRYAWTPLVCSVDADTLLDPGALSRLVWEFTSRPDTVAAGGIVRVVNGCTVVDGRVVKVGMPKGLLPNLQVLEYLRAFLGGRIGWSRMGMTLIISGAFGLFDRAAVVAAGGWDPRTIGEDAELVLRLHRHRRDNGLDCRIMFFPDPICWTEVPSTARSLVHQRDRWQRGLIQMLLRHRGMIFNRRYGAVGMLALPFFVFFEALGPLVEVTGYLAFGLSCALGIASGQQILRFLALAIGFGFCISYITLLMEERAFQRYPGWGSLGRLLTLSVLENVGYRQWMALVRSRAWWSQLRGDRSWGAMPRAGFRALSPTVVLPRLELVEPLDPLAPVPPVAVDVEEHTLAG